MSNLQNWKFLTLLSDSAQSNRRDKHSVKIGYHKSGDFLESLQLASWHIYNKWKWKWKNKTKDWALVHERELSVFWIRSLYMV